MEINKTVKKARKPRIQNPSAKVTESNQANQDYKGPVMLGIDPAFIKCGFGLISLETGQYIHSFQQQIRPDGKFNQGQVDGFIANNVQKIIDDLFARYKIEYVVIELQLGQYSANRIQLAFVQALPQNVKFTVQHSKLKLKHKEIKDIQPDNLNSKKYNQNKHQGRQLAKTLFPDIPDLSFDEYDSILHCKYAYDNLQKIEWIVKENLK